MSSEHFEATLERVEGRYAIYRYTPDSIEAARWGRMRINMDDGTYEVLEYAPSDADERRADWWPDTVCAFLAKNYMHFMKSSPDGRPLPRFGGSI